MPGKEAGDKVSINAALATKVISDYTSEWKAARADLNLEIGHRFNFDRDYQKLSGNVGVLKNLPTLYAAQSPKEWFAESFSLYARGGASRERLESIAPKTAAAVKTVLTGRIFK